MESINEFKRFWKRNDCITGKKIFIKSVCPAIYQRHDVKLGVLLTLIGGVAQFHE
jgi:DNA replicative helicase MCM subunit Mcm2 (Cdc46/Mcm family)